MAARAPRYELPITVEIRVPGCRTVSGLVGNISATGMWIQYAETQPDAKTEVQVVFSLERAADLILPGSVVRHAESSGFAVSLSPLDECTARRLDALLQSLGCTLDDDDTVPSLVGHVLKKLGRDGSRILRSIAQNQGTTLAELMRRLEDKELPERRDPDNLE